MKAISSRQPDNSHTENFESNQHTRRISQETINSSNEINVVNNFPGQTPRFIRLLVAQIWSSTVHRLQLSLWRVRTVERISSACLCAIILEHRGRLLQTRSAPRLLERSRAFCIHYDHRSSCLDQQPARADTICACDYVSVRSLTFA